MDYKKLADDARESAVICHGAGLNNLSGRILCYADAIEDLLEQVEQMKNLHMKVQVGYEELLCNRLERMKKAKDDAVHDRMMAEQKYNELYKRAEAAESRVKELEFNRPVQVDGDVFELAVKLAEVTAERDKAISDLHKAVKENGICSSCKYRFKECAGICMCDADGEDHWEWEGLDG